VGSGFFFVSPAPRLYKEGWLPLFQSRDSNQKLVVGQLPVGKNMNTEAEDTAGTQQWLVKTKKKKSCSKLQNLQISNSTIVSCSNKCPMNQITNLDPIYNASFVRTVFEGKSTGKQLRAIPEIKLSLFRIKVYASGSLMLTVLTNQKKLNSVALVHLGQFCWTLPTAHN
jgi:hypothetical protein